MKSNMSQLKMTGELYEDVKTVDTAIQYLHSMDTKRGGFRPGAGRKCLPPGAKKVPVSFSVSLQAKEEAGDLRRAGVDLNAEVEDFICERWKYFDFPK